MRRMLMAGAIGAVIIVITALSQCLGGEPGIVLHMRGGAGTIKAEKVWEQGADLCWESRGHRECTAKERVATVSVAPHISPPASPPSPLAVPGVPADGTPLAYYLTLVDRRIQENWVPPRTAKREATVVLRIRVLRSGELKKVEVEQFSGDPAVDAAALRALRRSVPLPPFRATMPEPHLDLRYRFTTAGT